MTVLRGASFTRYDFGASLSARDDSLLVGAPARDYDGELSTPPPIAFLFARTDRGWTRTAQFVAPDPALAEGFARAVALDSSRVVVSAPGYENGDGAVSTYTHDGSPQRQLDSPARNIDLFDQFGSAVAVDGESTIIGACLHGEAHAGAVYVFRADGSIAQTLHGRVPRDGFGSSVAVDGELMIVGASAEYSSGQLAGACYVFRRSSSGWYEHARVDGRHPGEAFGTSVAVCGDLFAAGAPGRPDLDASSPGRVDIYRVTATGSERVTSLDDVASFGAAVTLRGDRLAVGQPMFTRQSGPSQTGRVGLYRVQAGATHSLGWLELDELRPYARLGASLAFGTGFLAAGAPGLGDANGSGEVSIAAADW